jgi:hypothetical protein
MSIDTKKLDLVLDNYSLIKKLKEENVLILNEFLSNVLLTGEQLVNIYDTTSINNKKLVFLENCDIPDTFNNKTYILQNKLNRFFVSEYAITEISFKDSLDVWEEIEIVDKSNTQYVIELTFKSKRKNLREEKIKKNKFRFVYSTFSNKVTCKRLTE